ncbi:hypothetical protein [Nevskia sp.]|uniref:hypothetical protein n=1 Tax=Nevskia sp. TaxID=1929292 RepID=UPI0025F741CC|nr:hypothetical protein [Nevskia sp.]
MAFIARSLATRIEVWLPARRLSRRVPIGNKGTVAAGRIAVYRHPVRTHDRDPGCLRGRRLNTACADAAVPGSAASSGHEQAHDER